MDNFGIWEVDETTKAAHPLEKAARADAEAMLEDIFVETPAMLMPGLKLVGRQLPTANGYLDLLGVDSEGRLVVFELKRGTLTRDAVAQALDYASWLDLLEDAELWKRIAENSGRRGIVEIKNFEEWFNKNDNWSSPESLRPVKVVLVGLGADESAQRMAGWLAGKGVEIDLLTFLGYRCGERLLLARRLESGDEAQKREKRDRAARATVRENREEMDKRRTQALYEKLDEYKMRDWWDSVFPVLARNFKCDPKAGLAITFHTGKKLTLPGGIVANATHKIEIAGPGEVRIIFFPAVVDLCLDEFNSLEEAVGFQQQTPINAPRTEKVAEQWSCRLNESRWREHKDSIAELVRLVDDRWREAAE